MITTCQLQFIADIFDISSVLPSQSTLTPYALHGQPPHDLQHLLLFIWTAVAINLLHSPFTVLKLPWLCNWPGHA